VGIGFWAIPAGVSRTYGLVGVDLDGGLRRCRRCCRCSRPIASMYITDGVYIFLSDARPRFRRLPFSRLSFPSYQARRGDGLRTELAMFTIYPPAIHAKNNKSTPVHTMHAQGGPAAESKQGTMDI
jgi:hypothetical protein